jgi:hypothetical protein
MLIKTRRLVGADLRAEAYLAALFVLIGGVVVAIAGLIPIANLLWFDVRRRQTTDYGLTDRRAILVTGLRDRLTRTLDLRSTVTIDLHTKSDGMGTIRFGGPISPWRCLLASLTPHVGLPALPAFEQIADAEQVYQLIQSAKKGEVDESLAL